ncbi:MAG: outer membrane lipoprotein-sorting protein [Alcanivoracaceae bacterium]|nr:outer membrane lipoprotein-sorting protein [Alcanivoracaceae bacterium]
MLILFTALPQLYKDTRSDAFLAADNPALLYREKVKAQFGLSDPIVIAVINKSENGVFNPQSLQLVSQLTEQVSALKNINSDRVISLATENNITGSEDGMEVELFFEVPPLTQFQADNVWKKVSDFPLYMGNMVAKDKQATLIVAELVDENQVEETYQQILQLIAVIKKQKKTENQDEIHVAGEGAISGYLGSYIDADAQRLNPLAGIIITLIILFAFRRVSPGILSNVIIAASVLMTLSIMALNGVAFFVITNALPVILIGISVADSIHIYSHYFELHAKDPHADKKGLIVKTLVEMWRPITLTTLTTMAGFIGLYFAAYMPPFKYFGLYTAIGVAIAWLYSLVFLPAAMTIIKPSASKHMIALSKNKKLDAFSKIMVLLGGVTIKKSRWVIAAFVLVILTGLFAASHLRVNQDRIETFHHSEPLYQADKAINSHFNGTNNIDIVIETTKSEGLFNPDYLKKMQALQDYALTINNVNGATSIVDYIKQMNRVLNGGAKEAYALPQDRDLLAQYFLIYSASSDPTDFEEEIDYDYRIANMRLTLNKGSFVDINEVVEQLQTYIQNNFNNENIKASLSGRVTVNYHWIKDLGESHFVGMLISMLLVWTVSALLFRSMLAGLFAIIPVASSILFVYSAMVFLNIDLGIGTSMFASVAIGLGVDFSIHTIDRLQSLYKQHHGDMIAALQKLYPSTGRALFFNYIAIACGFGVLISSKVVPLNNFGTIVVISVTTSFFASMSLLPALINVFKPQFITGVARKKTHSSGRKTIFASVLMLLIVTSALLLNQKANAQDLPNALEVVEKINLIDDGDFVSRNLTMRLTDKRGKTRVRETMAYRKYYGDEKRTIIFYKKPSNIKGTSFLTFDYPDVNKDDDQWLYLPALRKVRRISASDRGDYFLGTDFTYEDIKLEGRLELKDYNFKTLKLDEVDSIETILIRATAKNDAIVKELGYGHTELWVDTKQWIIIKAIYWDPKGELLKTLHVSDIKTVDGIITRHKFNIDNHQTGHHTEFVFSNVDYKTAVKDSLFTKRAMKLGK